VGLISIPTLFEGLAITESSKQELEGSGFAIGLLSVDGRKCFKLEGSNWHGAITAGHVGWIENDAEYYADSKLIALSGTNRGRSGFVA